MVLDTDLEDLPEKSRDLHDWCVSAGNLTVQTSPSMILLITPHGFAAQSKIIVYQNDCYAGSAGWNGDWEGFCVECNNASTHSDNLINQLNANGVEAEGLTAFTKSCPFPLAWGEVVPLWFIKSLVSSVPVIIISVPQSRIDPLEYQSKAQLLGRTIYSYIKSVSNERVFLLVSGDLSHVHGCDPNLHPRYQGSPLLGSDPDVAEEFDSRIVQWAEQLFQNEENVTPANQILQSSDVQSLVVPAKVCGFAGINVMQGCLGEAAVNNLQWIGQVFGYAHPTYYGMVVAAAIVTNAS